jgi:hypothetical protein
MSAYIPSKLDADQVLRRAYDEDENRLRVDAEVTATIGEVSVIIDDTSDSIKIGDGTGTFMEVNSDGSTNNIMQNSIVPYKFDGIYPTYPNPTTEIYVYKQGGTTVATVTVIYTDASKNNLISVVRS